jgi:hypothetical protein
MCDTQAGWRELVNGRRPPARFPLDVAPVWQERIWMLPTANAAGLYGCFQLWNRAEGAGAKRFPEMPTAAGYNVKFALSYPEHARTFLQDYEILHLDEPLHALDAVDARLIRDLGLSIREEVER